MVVKKPVVCYDPSLVNLPVPQIALEKAEKAKKALRKNPFPDSLRRI